MTRHVDFLTASLLTHYPDEHFIEDVQELMGEPELSLSESLRQELQSCIQHKNKLDDLRSEYIDLFDRGSPLVSLYETEYGRDRALAKGAELADLSGFYQAFGFEFSASSGGLKEMRDHVSVELEFYTLLLMKQATLKDFEDVEGTEIVLDARKKFLKDHLGRFVGAIADRSAVQRSLFYSLVLNWCRDVVAEECKLLDLEITPVTWVTGQQEEEKISCGNVKILRA